MIVRVAHAQREGGTAVIIGAALWLMAHGIYKPQNVASNQTILIHGVGGFTDEELSEGKGRYKNVQIKEMLRAMVKEHLTGKLFILAEADNLFPPRFWHDKSQTEALIGVQQDEKMGNSIWYDCHLRGVDVLLDSATQIEIICRYRREHDRIDCEVTWLHDMKPHKSMQIDNVSKAIFPYFWTREPVS